MPAHADAAEPGGDPVGPAAATAVPAGAGVIGEVIAPGAADADRYGVPRSTIDSLAAAGLLGDALSTEQWRETSERLAAADASTWFCWVQHVTPLRVLAGRAAGEVSAGSDVLRARLLPELRTGRRLAAVAFAHLRRPGPPNPVATRVGGGWRLDGRLDWVTSWDIADDLLVMARGAGDDADAIVCAYLPAGLGPQTPGLAAGEPLRLLAMSGTHTRPITLTGVVVPDERVGAVLDAATWSGADARTTADASPATFGVVRGALAELASVAAARGDTSAADFVERAADECRALRGRAYALADTDGDVEERLTTRAEALDLAVRAAQAVVVARSGGAMRSGCSAERRMREALFLLVQAQTAATRAASLSLLTPTGQRGTRTTNTGESAGPAALVARTTHE